MTEQIKSIINELDVMGGNCSTDFDYIVCHTAIRSLNAWSEVLQELESRYNGNDETVGKFEIGITDCINIIKQKLAEIEEAR